MKNNNRWLKRMTRGKRYVKVWSSLKLCGLYTELSQVFCPYQVPQCPTSYPFVGGRDPYNRLQEKSGYPYSNLSAGGPSHIAGSPSIYVLMACIQKGRSQGSCVTAPMLPKHNTFKIGWLPPLVAYKTRFAWISWVS